MKIQANSKNLNQFTVKKILLMIIMTTQFWLNGCGDSNLTGISNTDYNSNTSSGVSSSNIQPDSTSIVLSMSLRFKNLAIKESKLMESNNGNRFNRITSIEQDVKPGEELDLQEIQPYGIFSLYLSGTGTFALTNSDGMNFTSKTILLEKCSFIDLKLINTEQKSIHVSGYLAGE
ncbi:MAG TPA: hypothetical protein PKD83_05465 [Ignavibacteria bacterium]|nr:hypothetical protein [Ignavibacteria bacterium]